MKILSVIGTRPQYVKIKPIFDFCNENNVTLLRTVGVMFADTEKRVSDYVN